MLLPVSHVFIREDQFLVSSLSDKTAPDCKNYDVRINVYRDVTNDMRSVSIEEKRTVILSPEDYNDDHQPIISDLWIPLDSVPYTIENINDDAPPHFPSLATSSEAASPGAPSSIPRRRQRA